MLSLNIFAIFGCLLAIKADINSAPVPAEPTAVWSADEIEKVSEALGTVLKEQFSKQTNLNPAMFQFISYAAKQSAPGGINYLVKVQISSAEFCHLRILKPQQLVDSSPFILSEIRCGKTNEDPIRFQIPASGAGKPPQMLMLGSDQPSPIRQPLAVRDIRGSVPLTKLENATAATQSLIDQVKAHFMHLAKLSQVATYEAVSQRHQIPLTSGIVFIKVKTEPITGGPFVHLKVYKGTADFQPVLLGYQAGKTLQDSIEVF